MSTTIRTRAFLGDGEHDLALTDPMILELERVTGLGIGTIYGLLADMRFGFPHVAETIRLALIGGGATPADAQALCLAYVANRPLAETFPVALDALDARWNGVPASAPETPAEEASE